MHQLTVTTDLQKIDLDKVHEWLSRDTFWAAGRSREDMQRAADHSVNFAVFDEVERQIGYARMITDGVTFAWICDVYVAPFARGMGAGKALTHAFTDYADRLGVKRSMLRTRDAGGLYAQYGFDDLVPEEYFMYREPGFQFRAAP